VMAGKGKLLKQFPHVLRLIPTWLKPGVNEMLALSARASSHIRVAEGKC